MTWSNLNVLVLDASTEACSVALQFNGKRFHDFTLCPQSHSQLLLPMVDKLLKQANAQLNQLDALVYGRGPGSFTGIRIGIGVAQGLAFAANLPVVGVSTLQAMAQAAYQRFKQSEVLAAIDARMAEIYTGQYRVDQHGVMQAYKNEQVLPPQALGNYLDADFKQAYAVGTGWQSYQAELADYKSNKEVEILYPDAQYMLTIALPEIASGNKVAAEKAQPVYVRDTVSWKKLPGRE